jgi:hypothetical protein
MAKQSGDNPGDNPGDNQSSEALALFERYQEIEAR